MTHAFQLSAGDEKYSKDENSFSRNQCVSKMLIDINCTQKTFLSPKIQDRRDPGKKKLLTQIAANCRSYSCKNLNLHFGLRESNLGRVIDHIDCDFSYFLFLSTLGMHVFYLLVQGLLNNSISSSDYAVSKGRTIKNDELERVW